MYLTDLEMQHLTAGEFAFLRSSHDFHHEERGDLTARRGALGLHDGSLARSGTESVVHGVKASRDIGTLTVRDEDVRNLWRQRSREDHPHPPPSRTSRPRPGVGPRLRRLLLHQGHLSLPTGRWSTTTTPTHHHERFAADVEALRAGERIAAPVYDWRIDTRTVDITIVEPRSIVIIEGILC